MASEVYFRAGVGMIVSSKNGLVLVAERSDVPSSWQAPQGGLGPDEEPVDAVRRELSEETGVAWSDVSVIDEYPEWLAYELPLETRTTKTGRGQVQKWFLLRYRGSDDDINLFTGKVHEFKRWKWVSMTDLIDHAWLVRKPIYSRLAEAWSHVLESGR